MARVGADEKLAIDEAEAKDHPLQITTTSRAQGDRKATRLNVA